MIAVLFAEKSNIALASKDNHTRLYVASYIPGPWSESNSTAGGITEGNIVLANPTSNSLTNLTMTTKVDNSETIIPSLRLWDSNYTLNTPTSFLQSVHLFEDMENFSTQITSISIEPNQKETISLVFPSPQSFQFSNHSLTIYISKNSFGDIINGQLVVVPETEGYLQIVNFSTVESDVLKSNMVTVAYNPNFYQRYHNISEQDYYADNFGILHYMGALDYTYFNLTIFNNNTFPVNSVTLFGQVPSRGNLVNMWVALNDFIVQPSETCLFPVAEHEPLSNDYVTGYVTSNSASSSPTSTSAVPEFSWLAILPLFLSILSVAVMFNHRKTTEVECKGTII